MLNQISDAGRALTHINETNDCTVIAMAHAAGVDYATAHEWARQAGRRNRGGMDTIRIHRMIEWGKMHGKIEYHKLDVPLPTRSLFTKTATYSPMTGMWTSFRRPRRKGITVAQFLRTLPRKGRFYLGCTAHAFAVVDGVVMDNLYNPKMRATMHIAYEITPTSHTTPAPQPTLTQTDINAMMARLDKIKF